MIHPSAHIHTDQIGDNVRIMENVIIRSQVCIKNNVIIHPNVVIEENVEIGEGVEIFPGAYIGKEPKGAGALARVPTYRKQLIIGDHCSIGPNAVIYYDVCVEENVLIGDGASIREQCRIGHQSIIGRYVTVNYNVQIGANVKIMDHTWLAGNMIIGNNVFISGGVVTANDNQMGQSGYSEQTIVGPEIRDGVVIGAGAVLLPNIVIEEKAVIAAGSVVTKSVGKEKLVMGVPARHKETVT